MLSLKRKILKASLLEELIITRTLNTTSNPEIKASPENTENLESLENPENLEDVTTRITKMNHFEKNINT